MSTLSISYARLGRRGEAIETGLQALDLVRWLADPGHEASVLNSLAEAYHLAGDDRAALQRHREALAVADSIGDVEEQARAKKGIANASAGATDPR